MGSREEELLGWASAELCLEPASISWRAVAGDASQRRYFRLGYGGDSWICADSPPATENNSAFVKVRSLLADAGLPVPELLRADLEKGFLLLEDLGDRHLLQVLDTAQPSADYHGALPLLLGLQAVDSRAAGLPEYSEAVLRDEFSRFYQWFYLAYLERPDAVDTRERVETLGELLVQAAREQPQVLVYRDYHSRNLLPRGDGSLGLIDFQDAVTGPLCYDLASLLKDCYIRWPAHQVRQWALYYRQLLLASGRAAGDGDATFLRWVDWIGLHRHIKCLGNFTRLALRDDKPGYLKDIPLVLAYIMEVLQRYPEFADFADWFAGDLGPDLARRGWLQP